MEDRASLTSLQGVGFALDLAIAGVAHVDLRLTSDGSSPLDREIG
jgi:hypothetical protein